MPRISDSATTSTAGIRRSVRARKTVISQPVSYDDFDDEKLKYRMPEGYNPSDDSEDEYVSPSRDKRRTIILTQSKRRKKRSDDDSDNSEEKSPSSAKRIRKPCKKLDKIQIAAPSSSPPSTPASGRKSVSSPVSPSRTITPASEKRTVAF